jgi:type III pantothenate kinase
VPDLVIDEGNSRIKFGVFEGQSLLLSGRISNFSELENLIDEVRPRKGLISSVKERDDSLFLDEEFDFEMLKLSPSTRLPIRIKYRSPETLGMDRIVGVVGANFEFPDKNVLVVDMGTCITADLLIEGEFLGGWILPGINMQLRSMHEGTGQLPKIEIEKIEKFDWIGNSTNESMKSGVVCGVRFSLTGLFEKAQNAFGNLILVITGGDMKHFDSEIKEPIFARPNLNLSGLNRILSFNDQVS